MKAGPRCAASSAGQRRPRNDLSCGRRRCSATRFRACGRTWVAAALVVATVHAYPEYVNCGVELKTGQRWMGKDSEASALGVSLVDAATGASVDCGSSIATGTRLRATIASLDGGEQYVLEAVGADVSYGNFCAENTRSNDAPLEFDVLDTVSVVGAHAPTYGTVYVTAACTVTGVGPTPTPKPSLTRRPTMRPTTVSPTLGACASERDGLDFAYALDSSLTLHWTLLEDRVRAELVTSEGWAAWGWGSDGLMAGAECVVGEPDQLPQKYLLRGYRREDVQRMARQSLIDASTTVEEDGSTVYAFTKLIEEPGEKLVTKGAFIWARGGSSLGYHGNRAGALELNLATCDASKIRTETVSVKLIKIHGGLFLVAFSVCMPAALVAARGRSWLGPVWIKLHMYLLLLCVLLAVAGFVVVFVALEDAKKDHFRGRHQRIGLSTLCFLLANVALGLVRPGKEGRWRPHFNVGHAFLGAGVFVLSVFATRSGATKAENLQYVALEQPWVIAQAALLGGFGAIWLLAWARAARLPKAETPVDSPKKEPEETAEESKREEAGGLEFVVPAGASTLCGTTTGSEMDRTCSSVLCL